MNMTRLIAPLFFFVLLANSIVFGQRNVKDDIISTPLVGVHYGGNNTSGDLADRYGFLNHIGIMAGNKSNKNWFVGMDANFMFGNKIRETGLFDHLVDSYGNITDINGDIGQVYVYARGVNVNFTVGKIIPVFSPNKNSGLLLQTGVGYLLHRTRIETQEQVIPQIELDYKKGYDRLTIGPNVHQFIGYSFMANGGYYNFYAGFYAQQGFTKNQRTIFFDQPDIPVSKDVRLDVQYGFRLGWYIPFYKRKPKDFYID
jgi:hypothetical protein